MPARIRPLVPAGVLRHTSDVMRSMGPEISRVGEAAVVALAGSFDSTSLPAVATQVDRLLDAGTSRLVFDFRKVVFVNSSSLGYVLRAQRRAETAGGGLVLVLAEGFLRSVIATLGLDRRVAVVSTVEEAVARLATPRTA